MGLDNNWPGVRDCSAYKSSFKNAYTLLIRSENSDVLPPTFMENLHGSLSYKGSWESGDPFILYQIR